MKFALLKKMLEIGKFQNSVIYILQNLRTIFNTIGRNILTEKINICTSTLCRKVEVTKLVSNLIYKM